MDTDPFKTSPFFEYDLSTMMNNISLLKKTFKSYKFITNNFLEEVHEIYNDFLSSARDLADIMKAIEDFKVSQINFISNFKSLSTKKFSDGRNNINFSNHESFESEDCWKEIYPMPARDYCVKFEDGGKVSVLDIPSIQINVDNSNRSLSLQFISKSFNKVFTIIQINYLKL